MKINPTLFSQLGVTLPANQSASFNQYFMDTLSERVGYAIAELLNDDELNELLDIQASGDTVAAQRWIENHVPDYQAIAQDEYDILLGEVADNAQAISA